MTWDAMSGVSISHTGRCLCDLKEIIDGVRCQRVRVWRSPLGDVETPGELGLADRLTVTKLVRPDFLERVGAQRGESFGCAGPGHYIVAEFGELGSIVAV